jgi:hypothetical protein
MEVPLKEEVYSLEFKSLEIIMGLSGDKESILEEMESKDYPLSFWLGVLTNYIRKYFCCSEPPPIEMVGDKVLEKMKNNKDLVRVYAKVLFVSLSVPGKIGEIESFKKGCMTRIKKE